MKVIYRVIDPGLRPGGAYVEVDNVPRYLHDRIEADTDTTDPVTLRVLEGLESSLLERGIVEKVVPDQPEKPKVARPPKGETE